MEAPGILKLINALIPSMGGPQHVFVIPPDRPLEIDAPVRRILIEVHGAEGDSHLYGPSAGGPRHTCIPDSVPATVESAALPGRDETIRHHAGRIHLEVVSVSTIAEWIDHNDEPVVGEWECISATIVGEDSLRFVVVQHRADVERGAVESDSDVGPLRGARRLRPDSVAEIRSPGRRFPRTAHRAGRRE
jgi:hypothetical protein